MRRVVLRTLVAFGVGASLTWYYRSMVFGWLLAPAGDRLSTAGPPIFTSPTEMMTLTIKVAMAGGVAAALPILGLSIFWTLGRAIGFSRAYRRIGIFLLSVVASALCGVAFAHYVLLPASLRFLLGFGADIATPTIKITEYMDLVWAMFFWLAIIFELPLAMFLLAKMGIVDHKRLRKLWKFVPAAAFILAAIITPTFDIVNLTLMAVPMILLFEFGVFLAWLARPRTSTNQTQG